MEELFERGSPCDLILGRPRRAVRMDTGTWKGRVARGCSDWGRFRQEIGVREQADDCSRLDRAGELEIERSVRSDG